ncbi:multicopper oxidase domain-containing protein, partial [Litoreibacter halocynthiae]
DGWKDTVLIDGTAELLMQFEKPASATAPFMYHCHILEHEDGGMMGQFSVA